MKRTLGLERVFYLGDYKSLRVTSFINDVPDEIVLDEDAMKLLRELQLVEMDKAYYQYRVQALILNGSETDEGRLELLVEKEAQVYANIQSRLEEIQSTEE